MITVFVTLGVPSISRHLSFAAAPPGQLANVRYIYRGLMFRPPRQSQRAAWLHAPLFDQYLLHTGHNQKASIQFRDSTTLHLNQRTDAVISSHVVHVRRGEVAEYLAPGTDHKIQTATAIAGAIGTTYDMRTDGVTTTFIVLHGALEVTGSGGRSVVVKSNHETVIAPNKAPSPPSPVDAQAAFAWTDQIPTPDLGEDVGLDANGGRVIKASSQRRDPRWHAEHINDGLLSLGWETAAGRVANQSVIIGFSPRRLYRIFEVIIDPSATGGDPASMSLKNFQIRVSSTGSAAEDFSTVYTGRCRQGEALQIFKLPVPVLARYVQLVALNNYGSPKGIAVAELEAVANVAGLSYPSSSAVDKQGNIYVADTGNDRIVKLSPQGTPLASWGTEGGGPGQFRTPFGLTLDQKGNIYVVDTKNSRIQKLSPSGKPLAQWGTYGSGPGEFSGPQRIALDREGNMYVTDFNNNRIQKLSPRGRPLAQWGTLGTEPGQFNGPYGIALDKQGNVYVSDYANVRIQKLSPQGRPLAVWGTSGEAGSRAGQFTRPEGMAVDAQGNVYVADAGNHRIQKLSPQGRPLAVGPSVKRANYITPSDVSLDTHGNVYAADYANAHILKLSSTLRLRRQFAVFGTNPQLMANPIGVAADSKGNVYVTDSQHGRIQKRSPRGRVLAAFGKRAFLESEKPGSTILAGGQLGQFALPVGVAISPQGIIYAADQRLRQIQVLSDRGPITVVRTPDSGPRWLALDRQGNLYVTDWGTVIQKRSASGKLLATLGEGAGLDRPEGITLDVQGNIYVVDPGNRRVVKLSPGGQLLASLGTGLGMKQPKGIAVDSKGTIYVVDTENDRILKLAPSGELMGTLDTAWLFNRPQGVAIDGQDNVYVADSGNARIVKLSPGGVLLAAWG